MTITFLPDKVEYDILGEKHLFEDISEVDEDFDDTGAVSTIFSVRIVSFITIEVPKIVYQEESIYLMQLYRCIGYYPRCNAFEKQLT